MKKRCLVCFIAILLGMVWNSVVSLADEFALVKDELLIDDVEENSDEEMLLSGGMGSQFNETITENYLFDKETEKDILSDGEEELEIVSAPSVKPAVITGLYNSKNGGDLRWRQEPGAEKYVIYRTNAGKTIKIATVGRSQTSYMDTSIKDDCWGKVYVYYVCTQVGSKVSTRGEGKTLQRLAPMDIDTLSNDKPNGITLTWKPSKGTNKANGYEIQYAFTKEELFNKTGSFGSVQVNGRNSLSITVTGLIKGREYCFRVRAYVNYTHSVTKVTTKTWSQYSGVKSEIINLGEAKSIDDYLVTVTITKENFDQYYKVIMLDDIQKYTDYQMDTELYDYYIISSNVFDKGLVFYDATIYASETVYKLDGDTHVSACLGVNLYGEILITKKGTVPKIELYGYPTEDFGQATYFKKEFLVKGPYYYSEADRALLLLRDGEIWNRSYFYWYHDLEKNSSYNRHLSKLYMAYPY